MTAQNWALSASMLLIAIAVTISAVLKVRALARRWDAARPPPVIHHLAPIADQRGVSAWRVVMRADPGLRAALEASAASFWAKRH